MDNANNETNSGNFPNYKNISTTDNKGIGNNSTNEEYAAISIMKNNTLIVAQPIFIKVEIISKPLSLTIS